MDSRLRRRLTVVAARAVVTYVQTIGEPYHDFQFDNVLFDPASDSLIFVDFGLPDHKGPSPPGSTALEISLGNLLGSTVFQSARPRWVLQRRQHREAADLCTAIVDQVMMDVGESISMERMLVEATGAYRRSAFPGRGSRQAWYSTVGYLVGRRLRIGEVAFGPTWRASRAAQ